MSGPDTYFDYRGRGMGTQYLLCEKFAHDIGVSLRVELCRDTAEMLERLEEGEGDIIVYQMSRKTKGLNYCGYGTDSTSWAVSEGNKELSDSLNRWYRPQLLAQIKKEEAFMYSPQSIRRHTYSPMLNASAGIISEYDHLFQKIRPADTMGLEAARRTVLSGIDIRPECALVGRRMWSDADNAGNRRHDWSVKGEYI